MTIQRSKIKIALILTISILCLSAYSSALEFNLRVSREEFAEFYDTLIIEQDFKELSMDDVLSSSFDPTTGKLNNNIFSARSPYFDPNAFKKEERIEEPEYKSVYNIKLAAAPSMKQSGTSFKQKLLDANKLAASGSNKQQVWEILAGLEHDAEDDAVNLSNIATVYIKTGNNTKALDLLNKAKQLAPDNYKILYTYGITLYKTNNLSLAESNLLRVTQLKSDFMYAHYNLGNVYYKQKEYTKALNSFKKAMELAPDNSNIYYNIAITLDRLGHKDLAQKFYNKCLSLNPNDKDAFKAVQKH